PAPPQPAERRSQTIDAGGDALSRGDRDVLTFARLRLVAFVTAIAGAVTGRVTVGLERDPEPAKLLDRLVARLNETSSLRVEAALDSLDHPEISFRDRSRNGNQRDTCHRRPDIAGTALALYSD